MAATSTRSAPDDDPFQDPTKVTHTRLLVCSGPQPYTADHLRNNTYYGRWFIFKNFEDLSEAWCVVRDAVMSGRLGAVGASCSTLWYDPLRTGPGPITSGRISVYVNECDYVEVGLKLVALSVVQHDIKFKTLEATWKGEFAHTREGNKRITSMTVFWNRGRPFASDKPQPKHIICPASIQVKHAHDPATDIWKINVVNGLISDTEHRKWIVVSNYDYTSEVNITSLWHKLRRKIENGKLPVIKMECPPLPSKMFSPEIHVSTSKDYMDGVGRELIKIMWNENLDLDEKERYLEKTIHTSCFACLYMDLKQLHLREVISMYTSFTSSTCSELSSSNMPVEKLHSFLLSQPAFLSERAERPDLVLYCHLRDQLEGAESIGKIVEVLSMDRASFINHDVFVLLAERYGSKRVQEKMQKYLEHFSNYVSIHNLTEFIEVTSTYGTVIDESEMLLLQFHYDCTLRITKVFELKTTFARVVGLRKEALRLLKVDNREGVLVLLHCPPPIARYLFHEGTEFSEQQCRELQDISLRWLKYRHLTFNFQEEAPPLAMPLGGSYGATEEESKARDTSSTSSDDSSSDLEHCWNRKTSLLGYAKDKTLHPEVLDEILQSLGDQAAVLDSLDSGGYAAIHYVIMRDHRRKKELLERLVISGADVNLTTGHQRKLTPLHLAVEARDKECLKALIALDADVNTEDFMGKTPLDLAFETTDKALMEPRVQLADSRITDILESFGGRKGSSSFSSTTTNYSPLKPDSSNVAQLAPPPGVKFRKINTSWYRITHDSVWEKLRNEEVGREALDPSQALELVQSTRMLETYRKRCGSRILCLDGGGIRGLLQMVVLREIERQTKKRIVELFDWIVGTSTGGIIALALTYGPPERGPKTVRQLRDIYWGKKDEIFGASQEGLLGFLAKGNTKKLEAMLKDWLGSDVKLSDTAYPKVLIPAMCKKDSNLEVHFFNNCFGDDYSEELVWKVGRYTSAAPFYFTELDNYIDGGMLANNPSEAALTAIQDFYHRKKEKIPISLLVSVGSGINPGAPLGKIDIRKNLQSPKAYLDLVEKLESAVVNKQTSASCMTRCREQGIEYFRFNPELSEKVASDQHDSSMLHKMLLDTRQYLMQPQVKQSMDNLIQLLNQSELLST